MAPNNPRETIKKRLLSPDLSERLEAARELSGYEDLSALRPFLESTLQRETNKWVRTALSFALDGITNNQVQSSSNEEQQDIESDSELRPIIQWISAILHELRRTSGVIQLKARKEVEDYDRSDTKKSIKRLSNSLSALEKIENITREPTYEDFDIFQLLEDTRENLQYPNITLAGETPFIIRSDKSLLDLIITNALRNSIEACELTQDPESKEILVNWGVSEKSFYISVLDSGVGIHDSKDYFEFGKSTKDDHPGIGLSLSERAARKMNGNISLISRETKGTKFLLTLPRRGQ